MENQLEGKFLKNYKQSFGRSGENQARLYLEQRGFQCLFSGFRTRYGEIDLVMKEKDTVVFVEVKSRSGEGYGRPEEAVTRLKQSHLIKAALIYIQQKNLEGKKIRFDVVSVGKDGIKHHQDAFWADGVYY